MLEPTSDYYANLDDEGVVFDVIRERNKIIHFTAIDSLIT